ncbi:alanine:cation symporter family protein [Candidatus Deianiraea vastatrix]|uniref:Amino acid carrier family protein n=1 Tax=Candidatus Deianiraea vastatrix TaxID=2163644 RepID=A0A5B8XJH7_9RICK|nr:alanine:cation symporter family protein [Candidatus Deianiraea vastatrix]QED23717.1 Putative amino acid carrier family protein [Candidatus Deianiraea vastatrix]
MKIVNWLNGIILYPIFGIPFAVLLILGTSIFLFAYLRFINFRGAKGIDEAASGNISKFSAFMTAAAGTLGVGNIFGGAMCVTIAGPGSIIWILILGVFGSIIKFSEVYLGHRFRSVKDGMVSGGSFFYLRDGFQRMGILRQIGVIYGIVFFIAYLAAGTFQINQIGDLIAESVFIGHPRINVIRLGLGIMVAIFTGFILFSGIVRIAEVLSRLVPTMILLYCVCAVYIFMRNFGNFEGVMRDVMIDAMRPRCSGGMIFMLGYSLHRILFASDTGTGVSAIANSQSNASALVQARFVSWEPILVSLTMCITGVCVLITNTHHLAASNGMLGVKIASHAFSGSFITQGIFICVVCLFGLTTTISHGYNVEQAWRFVMKGKGVMICRGVYIMTIIIVVTQDVGRILPIIDLSFFLCIILNIIGILRLSGYMKRETVGR